MRLAQPRDGRARAIEKPGFVKRMAGENRFEIGGLGGVEMHALPVDQQADGRRAAAPRQNRAHKRILDPQKPRAGARRHRLAPRGDRAFAPDRDQVIARGPAEAQIKAGKRQDAPHPALPQKSAVEMENPPGRRGPDGGAVGTRRHRSPDRVFEAVETEPTAPSVPVSAPTILAHWVKGASVT